MNRKRRSIVTILFSAYSLIIIMILAISLALFYFWAADVLKKKAMESISNIAISVNDKLDLEIQKMDTVSQNILYSNLVKERFLQFSNEEDIAAKELTEILVAANGPALPVQQINLYDFNGNRFGSGYDNRRIHIPLSEKYWYQDVLDNKKGKIMTIPEKDEELDRFLSSKDAYTISLCRLFFDKYNTPEGIVEVKQSVKNIFNKVNNVASETKETETILVYNDNGQLIYPIDHQNPIHLRYVEQVSARPEGISSMIPNPETRARELYSKVHSEYTGWNTVVIVSEKELLQPLTRFTQAFMFMTIAILFLSIFLTFTAAKRITRPISRMHSALKKINLETISEKSKLELNSGFLELEQLQIAFNNMSERLKRSMDQLLLSQTQELHSKMLALQSQMNPHFLYNTLTTISVMAEENMNPQIIAMIENLSDMLRYISADDSFVVAMNTELDYTEKYLQLIRYRFENNLNYSIEADETLRNIRIPKLVIQPLVENALKFCTQVSPPWNIRVRGYIADNKWFVEVTDNGPGFDLEKLSQLQAQIDHIVQSGQIPNLKLNGMGLLNIFLRLRLCYDSESIFQVVNLPDKGTRITIGGLM
ncbi:sensor histidine kinase [Cohnella sp.]|uniref:sensor histidine kinase n=1 Tax=Cohnella sp. TaxID=1883426 RepID=UPI00356722AB